jgi:hypothetical protein
MYNAPAIVYNPTGNGGTVVLTFVYPPRLVPSDFWKMERHDNVASSGVRESVYERTDRFMEFDMEWIASAQDLPDWRAFVTYARQGGGFSYFPASLACGRSDFVLEDLEWKDDYRSTGYYKFKQTWRYRQPWTTAMGANFAVIGSSITAANGAGSAPPAFPLDWLMVGWNGTAYMMPLYGQNPGGTGLANYDFTVTGTAALAANGLLKPIPAFPDLYLTVTYSGTTYHLAMFRSLCSGLPIPAGFSVVGLANPRANLVGSGSLSALPALVSTYLNVQVGGGFYSMVAFA